MSADRIRFRRALYAGASILAMTVASAQLRAIAQPIKPKSGLRASPPAQGGWTVWAEGGAFWTGGGPMGSNFSGQIASLFGATVPGVPPTSLTPGAGWEAAIGADYAFAATPWHVSFDARYGAAIAQGQNLSGTAVNGGRTFTGQESFSEHESHLVGDLMLGHDVSLWGQGQMQFGVRVADLTARFTGNENASCTNGSGAPCGGLATAALSADERSTFVGAGPRAAIEGQVPLGGSWAVEYMGGVAALFGGRSLTSTGSVTSTTGVPPFSVNISSSDTAAALNADATAAIAYWFSPSTKLSAGFRFDGYWNALKTIDANGNIANLNRFYYGPFLRLTQRF
jgi:hypothetical protein